ncbi:MAG: SIS domain-containing protein [Anaerolineaceae bacterium]|nr:SIS domain-containing protein [Anaerolineaceae bacterium]
MSLRDEIMEQPQLIGRLLANQWDHIQMVANEIREREINFIFLSARGTSDHAGLYAKYLWGAHNKLPIALAAPSLFSIYQQPPALKNALVVGISQSGESPDIVSVIAEGRRQGILTLSLTNAPQSPMAQAGELHVNVMAGPELAVAATKSYTAQLLSIALLSVALKGDKERLEEIARLPHALQAVLDQEEHIAGLAKRYRFMNQCVICGRGYNYATAYEWSLKLKEMSYVVSVPYSSADFRHGPIAIVSQGFPVFAVMPSGAVFDDLLVLVQNLKQEHLVDLLVISDRQEALDLADVAIPLPQDIPEWLSPIASILAGQLFAYYPTQAKGFNTESPRGLHKVTLTQ